MPDKPLTIATYAAGASLAAITLVYVFGPTFILDDEASSARKKGVVGLSNAANDCFINSILQALAGLPDLRKYLIREIHRRQLDGADMYHVDPEQAAPDDSSPIKPWKLAGLQKGLVTQALKDILDSLNERPLYKKTISPQPFIRALERAFGTRISRQQQDAQEFLQIITERLCDEYHAGAKARKQALKVGTVVGGDSASEGREIAQNFTEPSATNNENGGAAVTPEEDTTPNEEGFPFEGKIESQIECLTCGFKPRPTVSTFVTLTLNVPQTSSVSLNKCLDGIFRVEHIDDFKCDYCRLEHAIEAKKRELQRVSAENLKSQLESDLEKLQQALTDDPESPPEGIELPDASLAPKRRIARHMYISSFPKVLALHLSRSVFAVGTVSTKNLAKVSFPEELPLGGLLNRQNYRLLGLVNHKGTHNSGHYESFRRQVHPVPFSTPHSFGTEGVYSLHGSPNPSAVQSPRMSTSNLHTTDRPSRPFAPAESAPDSPSLHSQSSAIASSSSSSGVQAHASALLEDNIGSPRRPSTASTSRPKSTKSIRSLKDKASTIMEESKANLSLKRKTKAKRTMSNRWWRISDDKIKESKTSDVLGMQKEVYLLFYELDRR